jgi:hypothetical protein
LGAGAGEAGLVLDSAVAKVEADVRHVASELFAVAALEVLNAEETLLTEQLHAEEAIVSAKTDRGTATARDVAWTPSRVARVAAAWRAWVSRCRPSV